MDTKGVTDKILSEAKVQADQISKEAANQQEKEQAEHLQKLAEYKKQTEILAVKATAEKKSHLLAAARMDIAKKFLAEKRAILDEVFSGAQNQLQKFADDDYRKLMMKLMVEAVESGDEEVIVDSKDRRLDVNFIDEVNRQLAKDGKGNLRLSDEKQDIVAGFILRKDKIKINVSLSVLLGQAKEALEIELAKLLFSR